MIIYQYDNQGYFTGQTKEISDKDGCPKQWTRKPIPEIPEGKYIIFNSKVWVISDRPPGDDLNTLKNNKIRLVNVERYARIYMESIPYTFPGDDTPDGVQMRDEIDRQNIQDFVIDAQMRDSEDTMYFMPVSNNVKIMTPEQAMSMGSYLKNRGDQIMGYSWVLKSQIANVETEEDLNNIDITVGWPE
jgi:hypothetical protein